MRTTENVIDDEETRLDYVNVEQPVALSKDELGKLDAYWRACKYLAAGMIYLRANPLLREPLKREHIKQRLLGHWGSSPGLSFIYIHLNRLIKKHNLNTIFLAELGHGAPGVLAPAYLEGAHAKEKLRVMQLECQAYAYENGIDKPEMDGWTWQ